MFMHFTPSTIINYVAIIPGTDNIDSFSTRHLYSGDPLILIFELAQLKTDKSDNCQVWIPAPLSLSQM